MEYTVEELSPVKKKVNVTTPVEEVNAALSAQIAIMKMKVELPGFRKGKVPAEMIEGRFRKQVYGEATTDLINVHINEIMAALKLTPLSRLDVDGGELVKNEPFSYSFSFEVAPKIELPSYVGRQVDQEEAMVDPAEIDAVIERIRGNLASFVPPKEARQPQDHDVAVISFQASENGAPIEGIRADNFELPIGEGQALGKFEDIVKKLLPGQSAEEDVEFPADFLNPLLAGRTVTMQVTLHAIKEKKLPELDDAFAKKAGNFESMDALRDAINKSYMESRGQLGKAVAQKNLLNELMRDLDIPLPPALVEDHIDRMINELTGRLERQGRSLDSLGKSPKELRDGFQPEAEDLVRSQLFLLAVAQAEGLAVEPKEIEAYLKAIARKSGEDFRAVQQFHEENGLIFAIKDRILADKAMDKIWSQTQVTMVPPKAPEAAPATE